MLVQLTYVVPEDEFTRDLFSESAEIRFVLGSYYVIETGKLFADVVRLSEDEEFSWVDEISENPFVTSLQILSR